MEMTKFHAKTQRRKEAGKWFFGHWFFAFLLLPFAFALTRGQCAMCRTTAEAGGEASLSQGLNLGILALLVPPLAIFCAIFWTAYKSQQDNAFYNPQSAIQTPQSDDD
jgi:uncharacterized membrane protein YqaE (UPF0057 family)